MAGLFWPLCDCADSVRLHFNAFWHDNELNKADPLCLELVLRQHRVEACLVKLCEDEPDMLSMIIKQVQVDNSVILVGYAELVLVFV